MFDIQQWIISAKLQNTCTLKMSSAHFCLIKLIEALSSHFVNEQSLGSLNFVFNEQEAKFGGSLGALWDLYTIGIKDFNWESETY